MSDLDPEARALLRASKSGDQPSNSQRERVRRKLLAAIGGASVAGSAGHSHMRLDAASGAAKVGAGVSGKLIASVLVVTAAASGVAVWSHERLVPAAHVAEQTPAGASTPVARPQIATPVEAAAPALAAPATPPPHARAERRSAAAAHALRAQKIDAPAATLPTAAEPGAQAVPPDSADSAATDVTSVPKPVAAQDLLSRELALISQAQNAVRSGDSERALMLLQSHAAQFPSGALMQERYATQALAFCALGRVAEGRRAITRLAQLSPSSPLLGSARRTCDGVRNSGQR